MFSVLSSHATAHISFQRLRNKNICHGLAELGHMLRQQLRYASEYTLQVIQQPALRTTPLQVPLYMFCAAA